MKSTQIPIDFAGTGWNGQRSFHNTVKLSGAELKAADDKACNLEAILLQRVFLTHPDRSFTAYEVMMECQRMGIAFRKESSVRRALSNLAILDKYFKDGKPSIVIKCKRINAEFSPVANSAYGLNK